MKVGEEFPVGEQRYRAGRIDVRTQFQIVRRLTPALIGLVGAAELFQGGATPDQTSVFAAMKPFARALADMSDADSDYILDACLRACSRAMGGDRGWAPVISSGGDLMFEDIDLSQMMQIAFQVAGANLGGFFDAASALGIGNLQDRMAGLRSSNSPTEKTGSPDPSSVG